MTTNDPYQTTNDGQDRPPQAPPLPAYPAGTSWPAPPAAPPTSGMAVASLVLGIVGITIGWFLLAVPSILAVIFGHIGLSETSKGHKTGKGMAVAGLVLGYVVAVVVALGILVLSAGA